MQLETDLRSKQLSRTPHGSTKMGSLLHSIQELGWNRLTAFSMVPTQLQAFAAQRPRLKHLRNGLGKIHFGGHSVVRSPCMMSSGKHMNAVHDLVKEVHRF